MTRPATATMPAATRAPPQINTRRSQPRRFIRAPSTTHPMTAEHVIRWTSGSALVLRPSSFHKTLHRLRRLAIQHLANSFQGLQHPVTRWQVEPLEPRLFGLDGNHVAEMRSVLLLSDGIGSDRRSG